MVSELLAQKGCNKILWECGPSLATSAIKSGCIQELMTFIAPKILGGENSMNPFGDFEFRDINEVFNLKTSDIKLIGNDICLKKLNNIKKRKSENF